MIGQRVLVTGAGGFVGSSIVAALLEAGGHVIAVDRVFDAEFTRIHSANGQLERVEADTNAVPPFEVDALIHGAAVTASPEQLGQTPEANFRANMDPLLTMLDYARRQGVRRAIFISSGAVFRDTPPGPVSETQPPTPLGLYAVAKHTMEALVETLREVYGRDVAAVRLSGIYGPNEISRPTRPRISLIGRMIEDALQTGRMTVNPREPARDWTFAPDVGRAIVRLLDMSALRHALYNIASEQIVPPDEAARAVQAHLPAARIEVVEEDVPKVQRRGFLSSERFRQETGFAEWTSFADGLKQTIDWHLKREKAL